MKLFILTEGSKDVGFGYISRCLSLAQTFEQKGMEVEFIINGDNSVTDFMKGKKYRLFNWIEGKETLNDILDGAGTIMIDSYLADNSFYAYLSGVWKPKFEIGVDFTEDIKVEA